MVPLPLSNVGLLMRDMIISTKYFITFHFIISITKRKIDDLK